MLQTSAPIHHPQPDAARPDEGRGPAAVDSDALLHAANADPEPVYIRGKGQGCVAGLQDDAGEFAESQERSRGQRC
jgi:hypothetical protein